MDAATPVVSLTALIAATSEPFLSLA